MRILVINSGSSSLKFSIYETAPAASAAGSDPQVLLEGELSGVGGGSPKLRLEGAGAPADASTKPEPGIHTPADATRRVLDLLSQPEVPAFDAVGYRVVHPGPSLVGDQRITPAVLEQLDRAIAFAPLHDPAVLEVIRTLMARFPHLAHFACFDTEFHRTMPTEASVYAVPRQIRDAGVRRYGFHGLSCESVVHQLRASDVALPDRMVIAHLGSGCSVTAVKDGRSIDTSMGLTPDGGVVMGTRPGDLDPGLVLYLVRGQEGDRAAAVSAVEAMLNHDSGMVALSGLENSMQAVRAAATSGNDDALLATRVFTRCLRKTIGGFAWLLGGLDAIVFTGGIGEHDAATRTEVLAGLEAMGIAVDPARNTTAGAGLQEIGASHLATRVLVVPAREDLMIALHVDRMAKTQSNS